MISGPSIYGANLVAHKHTSTRVGIELRRLLGGYWTRLKVNATAKGDDQTRKHLTLLAFVRAGLSLAVGRTSRGGTTVGTDIDRPGSKGKSKMACSIRPKATWQTGIGQVRFRAVDDNLHSAFGKCVGGWYAGNRSAVRKAQFTYGFLNLLGVVAVYHVNVCITPEILYCVIRVVTAFGLGRVGIDLLNPKIVNDQ